MRHSDVDRDQARPPPRRRYAQKREKRRMGCISPFALQWIVAQFLATVVHRNLPQSAGVQPAGLGHRPAALPQVEARPQCFLKVLLKH